MSRIVLVQMPAVNTRAVLLGIATHEQSPARSRPISRPILIGPPTCGSSSMGTAGATTEHTASLSCRQANQATAATMLAMPVTPYEAPEASWRSNQPTRGNACLCAHVKW
jgi:hypothetical protein